LLTLVEALILLLKLNNPTQSTAPTRIAEGVPTTNIFRAMLRGSFGFAGVSIAGFAVWAFAGKWLGANVGESGLYFACALTFIVLSGIALHPLVHGPRSLLRFYKIFIPAFGAYALVWSASWFAWRFGLGEWLGSLAGSITLAVMIGRGFGNFRPFVKVSIVIFVLHSAGYFFGGMLMHWMALSSQGGLRGGQFSALAKLCWGALYGSGVGAGLGYAFVTFQIQPKQIAN
jgi:hypothetical protein